MKSALAISCLMAAGLTVASQASALHINGSASGVFAAASGADAPYISYYTSSGVRNTHTTSTKYVMGGLVRNEGATQTIWIFGYNTSAAATVTCYLYGRNYDGTLNDSDTITATGYTSYWWKSVSLTTLAAYANIVAYCALPPNGEGRVFAYSVEP